MAETSITSRDRNVAPDSGSRKNDRNHIHAAIAGRVSALMAESRRTWPVAFGVR